MDGCQHNFAKFMHQFCLYVPLYQRMSLLFVQNLQFHEPSYNDVLTLIAENPLMCGHDRMNIIEDDF